MLQPQPPQQRARGLAIAYPEFADKMLARDPALRRHALEVDRRAEMAAQIVQPELHRIPLAGALHLLAVERDQQPVEQLRLVEPVAQIPPLHALEQFVEQRRRLRLLRQPHHRAEVGPDPLEQRPHARGRKSDIAVPIRFRSPGRETVARRFALRKQHRMTDRHGMLAGRIAEERRPAQRALDHEPVAVAARGIIPAVADIAALLLGRTVDDGERIGNGLGWAQRHRRATSPFAPSASTFEARWRSTPSA